MTDESYSFSTARTRLEEIVSQVRKKDTSLEKSLDLLEEGVRLANACTELIDHQDWAMTSAQPAEGGETPAGSDEAEAADGDEVIVVEGVGVIDDVVVTDDEGEIVAEVIEVRQIEQADAFFDADDVWDDETGPVVVDESDDPSAPEG